jgi:pyridoxine 4-dehydrogenase
MGFTWVPKPVADEQAFESIKAGIDALPTGVKAFLNGGQYNLNPSSYYGLNRHAGEFYGPDRSNLYLISRFFKKYPEYADRTFLSIKGGHGADDHIPNSSAENLRRSVNAINEALGGAKRLDLFESARVDPKVPIEETIKNLKILIDEGLFDYIGLSECKAETLKRAHAVHPIAAVEIEVSLFSYEEETKKGQYWSVFKLELKSDCACSHRNCWGAWCSCDRL